MNSSLKSTNVNNELPLIKLPLIQKSSHYENNFHFFLRFDKPLKLVEPTIKYIDSYLLLTKKEKKKLKAEKIRQKKFRNDYLNKLNQIKGKNRYKNMIPFIIWKKCENIYDKCKMESKTSEKNSFLKKNSSMFNLRIKRNKKNKFENFGLNKFIENVENTSINQFHSSLINNFI